MSKFDSEAIGALIERSTLPMDAAASLRELHAALDEPNLSDHDRGQLLVALTIASQGSAEADELIGWLEEGIALLRSVGAHESLKSALGMVAAFYASKGDTSACLDRCLDLLVIVGDSVEPLRGRAALNFGVALLALGAYPIAAEFLEVAVADTLRDDPSDRRSSMLLATSLNLALAVHGANLVGSLPAADAVQMNRIGLAREATDLVGGVEAGTEKEATLAAVRAICSQSESDLERASREWGGVDSLSSTFRGEYAKYLAMVESPIALHRGDLERAAELVELCLSGAEEPSIVPYRRLIGLQLRADVHERRGNLTDAIADLREATDFAGRQASELPIALVRRIGDLAELDKIRRGLLDNASRMAALVLVDDLTGVGNRRGFDLCLDRMRESAPPDIAIVMVDVDRFKMVNDQHGHGVGDQVIAAAGRIIDSACRPIDQVFRYGGDEFAVVPMSGGYEVARLMAERILAGFASENWQRHGIDAATVSIGIGVSGSRNVTIEDVLAEADRQLYAAKEAGRSRIRPLSYDPTHD